MDVSLAYAIGLGGLLAALLFCHLFRLVLPQSVALGNSGLVVATVVSSLRRFASRHLFYATVLRERRYVGRWSRADVVLLLAYFSANAVCLGLSPTVFQAGQRAGTLALINMIIVFLSPHLSLAADILDVSLRCFRRIHSSAGSLVFILAVFHTVLCAVHGKKLELKSSSDLYALIVRAPLMPSTNFS